MDLKSPQLRIYPDPILGEVSEPVMSFDEDLGALLDALWTIREQERGAGVAAVQIGVLKRAAVLKAPGIVGTHEIVNPTVVSTKGMSLSKEGCLSVPDKSGIVKRATSVTVRYYTREGVELTTEFKGFGAFCIQHEIDHMDGILYTDKLLSK
jgi:peptide deformylase